MTTIYDIAKLCGISVATVSYVLNGRGEEKRISKATQEKVLSVAQHLNYRPNVTARQLKDVGSGSVKIAAFWPEFYYEQPMISAIRAIKNVTRSSAEAMDVSIHFFTPDNLEVTLEKTSQKAYNGIIMTGLSHKDMEYIKGLKCSVPIILVNRQLEGFNSVSINQAYAGQLAFDMAVEYGEEICAVWDSRFHVATNLRRTAFIERAKERGYVIDDMTQFVCEGSTEAGYELGMQLINNKLLKKVMYCNNESVSRGLLAAFNESSIEVGKDIYFFTANSGPDSFCRYMNPPLTAIDLRMQEVFRSAVELCLKQISIHENTDTQIVIQPNCVYRASMPAMNN